jgi:hypothetical protein
MPEARISPKVIFIGRARAGMPHDSADRASWEAATAWAVAARAHKARRGIAGSRRRVFFEPLPTPPRQTVTGDYAIRIPNRRHQASFQAWWRCPHRPRELAVPVGARRERQNHTERARHHVSIRLHTIRLRHRDGPRDRIRSRARSGCYRYRQGGIGAGNRHMQGASKRASAIP